MGGSVFAGIAAGGPSPRSTFQVLAGTTAVTSTLYADRERPHEARSGARYEEVSAMRRRNVICLWFDQGAEEAARFYAATFPDRQVKSVLRAPADLPGAKAGDVLTVEFAVCGVACLGLDGGPPFEQSEAFSFQIATDDQEETDRYCGMRS